MSELLAETAAPPAPAGRLRHFPVSFFAVVMGLGGLALAWNRAADVLGAPAWIGIGLVWLALGVEIVVLGAYTAKVGRHPDAVRAEVTHPVRLAFVPSATIALLLLAAAGQEVLPTLAAGLWWVGTVGQLILTLLVLSTWMNRGDIGMDHVHPAWFIPVVGPLVVPLAGVRFGPLEVSWFAWSVGLVFWLVMFPIVLARLVVHDRPMPDRLAPTVAVLVAPPAVGFVALLQLTDGTLSGPAVVLASTAVFLWLLFLVQLGRLRRLPFFLSWWSTSFPMAAASVTLTVLAGFLATPWLSVLAWVQLVAVSALVALLAARTLAAMVAGRICVPE